MNKYPSIAGSFGQDFREFDAFVFEKHDGSNLRAEWSPKRGFYKFGTRERMFDLSDKVFAAAIPLFINNWQDIIAKEAKDNRWESVIIFCEYLGDKSFAGWHDQDDPKRLALFDVNPYKKGILGPKDFVKLFGKYDGVAGLLGNYRWTRGFVKQVYDGNIPCPFEGVVGKAGERHDIIRAKAKTKAWIDKVKALHSPDMAEKIINS